MGRRFRGWFVTGTDTGVGKTVAACALARALTRRGIDVGVLKPVETGVGEAGPLDALALRAAAGVSDEIDEICPQRFALPAAPTAAARVEGRRVDLAAVRGAFAKLAARHETLLVEGAGGLLAPLAEGLCMADLARELGLPLLLVSRAALGTINHTLLSLEVAEARGLALAGVVISHAQRDPSLGDRENLAELRRALGPRLLFELPFSAGGEVPADAVDLEALLSC